MHMLDMRAVIIYNQKDDSDYLKFATYILY